MGVGEGEGEGGRRISEIMLTGIKFSAQLSELPELPERICIYKRA